MNPQALILRPTRYGWAIYLTGGSQLARFRGPGAHTRALRSLVQISKTGKTPPTIATSRPFPEARC